MFSRRCANGDLLALDRDRARLDLRQVEDVADQVQQVGAGAHGSSWRTRPGGRMRFVVRILGQLLAEDQDAVERRAQLVRHVGEELGLVARRQRELGRLFLQRAARLFDLLVLVFDLGLLLGEQRGLERDVLVGLLQLLLLRLQFAGELLRLRSRPSVRIVASIVLSTMPMLPVSCSRNARCDAVNSRQRGQLDHRLDLVFEQHRQHDHAARHRADQARLDLHRARWHVVDQDDLGLRGALADEPFAERSVRATGDWSESA